ncbi:2-isopropylmalate synthase [Ruminococcaceae bacterium OttesenSCG-928-L11]|nr:2-isopropylmalate synthase [Ruminococcaceae bacterium OttesenSCG-928-L11]
MAEYGKSRTIRVLDTTLRDGEQAPGCSMRLAEKLEIAKQLERLRVDVIEAGFPIASKDDFAAVREIAGTIKDCAVTGLCRAMEGDISCTWEAVKHGAAPMIHIFLATSDIHLEYKLHVSRSRLLEIARDAVRYARSLCPVVQFTAEDATRTDREFLLDVFRTVEAAGGSVLNIADTVGYTTPEEMADWIRFVKPQLAAETMLGVHCHNDLGMGTANTLSAVRAGADQFDATIAGIGERAGMAALEEVVMALHTRGEWYGARTNVCTMEFYRAGKLLANSIDLSMHPHKAIIGDNAFAHEAGVHQHGIMANPLTYEIMKPEDVGVHVNRMVMGKHSGKAALRERLEQLGYHIGDDRLEAVFQRFKALTDEKKTVNDADIEALVRGEGKTHESYSLVSFVVNSGTNLTATSVVKLLHDGKEYEHVARGETPVIAAFNAVDKIVKHSYPLHHFSIQSISEGRTELGESTVQIYNGDRVVTGRGLDTDIVEACIRAYLSAINNALAQ